MIKKATLFILLLYPFCFFGQINISEQIQASELARQDANKIYFVDFWATWCGPCINASKYLEALQWQYPNDFYVVSLSQENPETVKKFLTTHKTKLAVAIDFDGETFKQYQVQSLPYGVLLNAKGETLWQGHPADFKPHHVNTYLNENSGKISVSSMLQKHAYNMVQEVQTVEILEKDIEFVPLDKDWIESIHIENKGDYLAIKGKLQDILAFSKGVYKDQITIDSNLNKSYVFKINYNTKAYANMFKSIVKALRLNTKEEVVKGEVLVFNTTTATFWDTKQIDWKGNNIQYLIGDSEIQADNVTFGNIKYQLANLLQTPIVLLADFDETNLHDWQIHYKYYDLMVSNLRDDYGILVEKKTVEYPRYSVIKKRGWP